MLQVFHINNSQKAVELMGKSESEVADFILENQGNYIKVAEVLTESPEVAKDLTVSQEKAWMFNEYVVFSESENLYSRSTSDGDLIVSDKDIFLVKNNGLFLVKGTETIH